MSIHRALRAVKKKVSFLAPQYQPDTLLSPFPDLLQTNDPPSDAQIHTIRQSIAGAETVLSSLECQLHATPEDQTLLKRRAAHQEFVDKHRRILSPCRGLPFEILVEIFSWFIPANPFDVPLPYLYIRKWTPLRLVCRQWRAAIHGVPELFSYVPRVQLNKKTEDARYVDHLQRYLGWSAGSPLRVTVFSPFREYDSHPALEALMAHSSRWELLHMDVAFTVLKSLSKVKHRLNSLRFLTLDVWRYTRQQVKKFDVFLEAMKLEVVRVNGILPEGTQLPWEAIRSYSEKVVDRGALSCVATKCSKLETLEITQRVAVHLSEQATIPALKALRFRYDDVVPPDDAINKLILPSLEDVQIIGYSGELLPSLNALIPRSGCGSLLRRLAFRTQVMMPGELTRLLQCTPCLTELDIDHPPNTDARNLIADPFNGPVMVPLLNRLRIHSWGKCGDEEIFNRIGKSRCDASSDPGSAGVHPMTELRFVFEAGADVCKSQQAALEGWFDPKTLATATVQRLIELKNGLLSNLPEIDDRPLWDPSIPKKRVFDLAYGRRLHNLFVDIEKLDVEDVHHLHLSDIHPVLKRITEIRENHIPSDEKYMFRERAENILHSWRKMLIGTVDDLHWVRVGKHSLMYISELNELRNRKDAVEQIVYGMDDPLHEVELFWHRSM